MKGNLVIVESPAKAKKIQGYLGDNYTVRSSYGHIRDLQDNSLGIDVKNGFQPRYVIPSDKTKVVAELKKEAKNANMIWLASDEDREGEAIAWHLSDVLEIPKEKTKRIVFHEITKQAILAAVENPRDIDMNLVAAQQARRVLDRLVGFELSPVLWKKIQPKLSAGRVQSVALRLVVDREREIEAFGSEPYYRIEGLFFTEDGKSTVKAVLDTKFHSLDEAEDFLTRNIGATYSVGKVCPKEGTRTPAAPFTTSTLQQEAVRKLGLSVTQTMQIAQKLYEEGLITYMRTDSVNLSSLAINTAKQFILDNFGPEYSRPRQYRTKSAGAQEAHEAIRPTFIQNTDIEGSAVERKLYQLIWKRTVASQMSEARVLNTDIEIKGDTFSEKYHVEASEILFDGFLKVYIESTDDQTDETPANIPALQEGQSVFRNRVTAQCKFTSAPSRYNQASLVKKLEELGIGRPSTYASTIATLIKGRGYIVEADKEGTSVPVTNLTLKGNAITRTGCTEKIGAEKRRLLPQDIGIIVSDYLVEHFPDIVDYGFTADVEKDFDQIAGGKQKWNNVISHFYAPFKTEIDKTLASSDYSRLEREIGIDPSDGRMITARYGQWGPYVQKGEGDSRVFASLAKGQIIESLTLEEAVKLLQLPRLLGRMDGDDVIVSKGRFGAYLKFSGKNIKLPREKDPLTITLEDARELIREAENKTVTDIISQWGDIQIINGTYGPYIKYAGANYKIPRGTDAYSLKEEDAKSIVNSSEPTAKKHRKFKK